MIIYFIESHLKDKRKISALNRITLLYSVEKIDSSQRDLRGKNVSESSAVSHPRMQQRWNISYDASTKCSEAATTEEDVSLNWPLNG